MNIIARKSRTFLLDAGYRLQQTLAIVLSELQKEPIFYWENYWMKEKSLDNDDNDRNQIIFVLTMVRKHSFLRKTLNKVGIENIFIFIPAFIDEFVFQALIIMISWSFYGIIMCYKLSHLLWNPHTIWTHSMKHESTRTENELKFLISFSNIIKLHFFACRIRWGKSALINNFYDSILLLFFIACWRTCSIFFINISSLSRLVFW